MLLAVIVAAVIVTAVLLDGGGSRKTSGTGTSGTAATKAAGPTSTRLTLRSPSPASRASGVVEMLSEGGKHAFYIAAENLPATRKLLLRGVAVQLAHQLRAAR